jgi:hypothetical protein
MLRILGSPRTLCDGLSRREFLAASLTAVGRASVASAASHTSFGKAKACILLYLYGSPSQLETFDTKADAPAEIRGELGVIPSVLPGVPVGELLPHTAKMMDRITVLRSMCHPYPIHGAAFALTGATRIDIPMELNPHDSRHEPFIGSIMSYLLQGRRPGGLPENIALPFPFSSQRVGEVPRAGPYAAYLGGAYNPVWTRFAGKPTSTMQKTLREMKQEIPEPYIGITPESRFELTGSTSLPAEITLDRLDRRKCLLEQFDASRRQMDRSAAVTAYHQQREMAMSLIGSEKVRHALDLGRESSKLRETYGMTLFGQGAITARRLVEAGCRFVSVFWDEYGLAGSGWDTHWDHYNRMRKELMPGFDRAFSGLIADLDDRGMLDDTLVLVISEHGRTPKLNNAQGAGRDHWSQAYCSVLAGGGVVRGKMIGRTDKIAGSVTENPISPKDVLATAYHLMGIDHSTTLNDRSNRPVPLVQEARVLHEVLR